MLNCIDAGDAAAPKRAQVDVVLDRASFKVGSVSEARTRQPEHLHENIVVVANS